MIGKQTERKAEVHCTKYSLYNRKTGGLGEDRKKGRQEVRRSGVLEESAKVPNRRRHMIINTIVYTVHCTLYTDNDRLNT